MGQGRPAVTSKGELELLALELFAEHGFERTTVEDLAEAAGIGRRTFFRYFPSKNDVVYGDFDAALSELRARLRATPPDVPLLEGLREAVLAFNELPPEAEPQHRVRMALVLHTPALQAHSTLRYAGWRGVVAEHAAQRLGLRPQDFLPQLLAHQALASAVAAYEQWLAHSDSDLATLLDQAFRSLAVAGDDAPVR
ncbi:MAG TPA: mycofactocin system transcriptional regulator [Mycobacteriales bacterium]|nr:mycofactocin system transcriptional regulator [Mycobacteriales bacterium]